VRTKDISIYRQKCKLNTKMNDFDRSVQICCSLLLYSSTHTTHSANTKGFGSPIYVKDAKLINWLTYVSQVSLMQYSIKRICEDKIILWILVVINGDLHTFGSWGVCLMIVKIKAWFLVRVQFTVRCVWVLEAHDGKMMSATFIRLYIAPGLMSIP
jgi:hypothetical protein